jgi:hypothetical protein
MRFAFAPLSHPILFRIENRTMATRWYASAVQAVATNEIDLLSDEIKVMLTTSGYRPDRNAHTIKADVTDEVRAVGYTAGGKSLDGKMFVRNSSGGTVKWDAQEVRWSDVTLTFRYAVIYDDANDDKPLIGYVDYGKNQRAKNQDLVLKWELEATREAKASSGILEIGGVPSC